MIRPPAVAGFFYPDNPQQLNQAVLHYLQMAKTEESAPKALIAPHAGYKYSAAIAATVYARLASVRDKISRVILVGPCHKISLHGLAVSSASHFRTPLGDVPVANEAIQSLLSLPFVQSLEKAHSQEHSLEVQLPFLQTVLAQFSIVPIVVGIANGDHVASALTRVWGGDETLVVISSDLSHYHDYATAQAMDLQTTQYIENLQYEKLSQQSACGRLPIAGLLKLARENAWRVKAVDVRNSGDTAGSKDRVVGYGAYVLE
jgi:MEMO1 family protein